MTRRLLIALILLFAVPTVVTGCKPKIRPKPRVRVVKPRPRAKTRSRVRPSAVIRRHVHAEEARDARRTVQPRRRTGGSWR